ncbi:MAG: hypothetical protein IKX45_05550 [Bacteroidales bacterium]|nr:hypothetical protein [Bacteroidales bacterium]MBR5703698.1 hypothetical protein [Bacteroidales bacterium]
MEEIIYKVLWIDDQPEIVQGYQLLAGLRNIQLIHFENWKDAQPTLEREFGELTAIILDANCKLDASQQAPSERFLGNVLSSLMKMFGDRHREIPWYILSAGTMTNFDTITNVLISEDRRSREADWGETVYYKDKIASQKEQNALFENIIRTGNSQSNNIVLYRHRSAFEYMGQDALISDEARKIMLKALAVLYYPEENLNYEFAGNPIRKVVEYMFKAAYKYGLLTDAFLDDKGFIILWHSMEYLCGMESKKIPYRFGKRGVKPDYSDNESVLPSTCYNTFKGLLNYVNVDSHTLGEEDDSPYKIDAESKDLFFAYVIFLCHVITCFGKYVERHPSIEENKAKLTPTADKKLAKEPQVTKTAVEFIKNETAASFIGKEFTAINAGSFLTLGGCKVSKDLGVKMLQRARIDEVIANTADDSKKYPFIVTKVSLL